MKEEELEPQVNPQFWFNLSKGLTENIPEKINDSANNFEKLILWLWGIYTPLVGIGSGTLAVLGSFTPSVFTMILLLLPCLILLGSYWLVSKAKSSVLVKFAPDAWETIEAAYHTIIFEKEKYLSLAQKTTLAACAVIPISVFCYFIDKKTITKIKPDFQITEETSANTKSVRFILSGEYKLADKNKSIHLGLKVDGNSFPIKPEFILPPLPSEVIQIKIDIPKESKKIEAEASWDESENLSHTIKRKLPSS